MILVPRKEIVLPMRAGRSGVEGVVSWRIGKLLPNGELFVRAEGIAACRPHGKTNLITNQGLDRMGTNGDYLDYCSVGFGNTTPAFTDTQLANGQAVVGGMSGPGNTRGIVIVDSSTRYAYTRHVARFNAGVATGNISEIGIQWGSGLGPTVFSRSLVLDGGGLPTVIEKLADETLDITYEFRTYPNLTDVTGTRTINGIDYDYTIRPANSDSTKGQFGAGWGPRYFAGSEYIGSSGISASNQGNGAFTGTIGSVDGEPGGSGVGVSSLSNSAYVAGSYSRTFRHTYDTSISSNIRSVLYSCGWASWQIQYDPILPKASGNNLWLEFEHSWGRKTL